MGIKEIIKKRFGSKARSGERAFQSDELKDYGFRVYKNETYYDRIAVHMEFEALMSQPIVYKDLAEYCSILKARTDLLNQVIFQIAIPYGGPGDDDRFAIMLRGWTNLYKSGITDILMAERIVRDELGKETKSDSEVNTEEINTEKHRIETQISFMHNNIQKFVWTEGYKAIGLCFKRADVAPSAATVLQGAILQSSINPRNPQSGGQPLGGPPPT